MDESYEWDAEVALASDLLAALQLYRAGAPPRPLSTIALRDLERRQQRECGPPVFACPPPTGTQPRPPPRSGDGGASRHRGDPGRAGGRGGDPGYPWGVSLGGRTLPLSPAEPGGGGSSPVTSVSAEALAAAGGPPERGRRREGAQQRRRQRLGGRGGCGEGCELATLL